MTEETGATFQREGGNAFPTESTEEETTADSPSENGNQGEETQSDEGDANTRTEEAPIPFHQDPRWKEREEDWTRRFNDQETRHQNDLKSIREEFTTARKENAQNTKIPAWFGGGQEQWDAYRADRDAELTQAEERAEKRARDAIQNERGGEEKAVADATAYLRSEVTAIESDRTLNPSGAKIDAEKLLKVVLDNELIDSKGRWNYRAGYKLMTANAPAPKAPNTQAKKEVAAALESENRVEAKPKAYKTSADFKGGKAPW